MAISTVIDVITGMGEVENGPYDLPGARLAKFTITFDSSYPTGGEDSGLVGAGKTFENGIYLICFNGPAGSLLPKYDVANDKIKLYEIGYSGAEVGAAVAALAEIGNADNASTVVVEGFAIGY